MPGNNGHSYTLYVIGYSLLLAIGVLIIVAASFVLTRGFF
jgi:hypothetical protein